MEHSPPNCKYETFTIHTSSIGASSNTSFTSTFTRPIKDVVEASVIAASIRKPTLVSNVAYIRVNELESNFVDFATAGQPAVSSGAGNSHNFPTGSNFLRRCIGAIYNSDDATATRLSYKDRYHINTQYIYPIERLNELTITFYDNSGTELVNPVLDGITYLTFRFVSKRKNLC